MKKQAILAIMTAAIVVGCTNDETMTFHQEAITFDNAFVDNSTDLEILATEGKRQKMGQAIAKGILKTLGIEFQADTGTIYRVQVGAYKIKANAEAMQKRLQEAGFSSFITK